MASMARYREPFVRYLQAVYAGHDNEGTLAELTESSYTELDAQYPPLYGRACRKNAATLSCEDGL